MNLRKLAIASGLAVTMLAGAGAASAGPVLDGIRQRGAVRCGVMSPIPGWNLTNAKGEWEGFNIDLCRSLAAAVFGDPAKVQIQPTTPAVRLTALQTGELDVLISNVTETLTRDTELGLTFGPVIFYDGQAVMVPKKLNLTSVKELDGATICVSPGTTTELTLADYFRSNNMQFKAVVIENQAELRRAYSEGRCDAMTDDRTALAGERLAYSNPDDNIILPESLSKEPLAAAVRQGDNQWADILRWTVYALIEADELGIGKDNVEKVAAESRDPRIQRFLGTTPGLGKALGVDEKWAVNVIRGVGNYGEIYDRNIGMASPVKLPRGQNEVWTRGGLLYSRVFR